MASSFIGWANSWANSWGGVVVDVPDAVPDVVLLGGTFKRGKGSAWDKLLSPPIQHKLAKIEPEAAQEIEAQAVAEVTQPDHSEDQMREALDRLGIAYKEAYQEIYRELVAEMRQAQEDEQIAQIMVMLL